MVSKAKILAYYEDVVDSLVASGRVKFFWHSEYRGDGKFVSCAEGGKEYQVRYMMYNCFLQLYSICRSMFHAE